MLSEAQLNTLKKATDYGVTRDEIVSMAMVIGNGTKPSELDPGSQFDELLDAISLKTDGKFKGSKPMSNKGSQKGPEIMAQCAGKIATDLVMIKDIDIEAWSKLFRRVFLEMDRTAKTAPEATDDA